MTSTIYLAKHLAGGSATIPLFSLKGLDNHAPSTISSLGIEGIPLRKQLAYTEYANNISCFLHATKNKRTINITGLPLGSFISATDTTPIRMPPVHLTLKKALDSDRSQKLVNNFGPGASISVSGRTSIFQAPAFPASMINTAINLCPPHFNCGRDAINPSGALAFQFLNSVCGVFLRTHSYPAFSEESDETLVEMNSLLAGHTAYYVCKPTKDKEGNEVAFDPTPYSRTLLDFANDSTDIDIDAPEYISKLRSAPGRIYSSGNDVVTKAKPCPLPQTNIGSRQEAPNLPGIVFPYFPGLIQPDASFLHSTILRHFFQLLGSTVQECQEAFVMLRRGCGSLSTTKEGMAMTHLLKGITLSLETQTRCYMLFEANEYKGFVLFGAQFIVFDSTKWIVPGSEAEVSDAIAKLDPHESSVGNLVRVFKDMAVSGVYSGPVVTPATFAEPKNLIDVFRGVDIVQIDSGAEKEIDKYLRGLNYMGSSYWPRNPQTVIDAVKLIASEHAVELTRPTYFSSIRLPIHTKEYAALSKFGPESVSFWNERGSEIMCKAAEKSVVSGSKRKAGEFDLYANMPTKILITPKPLSVAVNDMEKVIKKGAIKIDLSERAGKYRNMCVESEEMRKLMWRELVGVSAEAHSAKKQKAAVTDIDDDTFDDIIFKLTGSM